MNSEIQGPDRSIRLGLQGAKGKHDVQLNRPANMQSPFQPGHKDEFYIENISLLGDIQSIDIDITHPNIKKLGLDYIEIVDTSTHVSSK